MQVNCGAEHILLLHIPFQFNRPVSLFRLLMDPLLMLVILITGVAKRSSFQIAEEKNRGSY